MRLPWTGLIQRRIDRAVELMTPVIASQAIESARPAIERAATEHAMSDLARAMTLKVQVPGGYPQTAQSPYPLYGMDRPIWYATPNSPKRRPDSIVDIDTIRRFADTYDVMRSCINHLKREVQAQPLRIAARDIKDTSDSTQARIAEALAFFTKRGGLGEANETRRHYEQKIFEDVLVIGAYASWKNKTLGGQLLQVIPIDASTIRPRLDAYGWPGPSEEWYEQWIMGMKVTGFKPDELVYDGLWPVTHTPWFRSPVEYLLTTTLTALKSDEWNRSWLTDGNTPGQMISTPPEWTPAQIKEYSDYFNAMLRGNIRERQNAQFIPGGPKPLMQMSRKDQDFQEFDLWLARRTGAIFGVQLSSIGFAGEQYKVSQEGSNDQTTQFGAGALLDLRKEHYDDILEDLGYGDLEAVNGATAEEDPLKRAQRLSLAMGKKAWMGENDARKQEGLEPVTGGDLVPQSVALAQAAEAEPDADPDAGDDTAEDDINRWMRKSLNKLKQGKPAACGFQSDLIPDSRRASIMDALNRALSPEAIRAAFLSPGENNL